MKKFKLLKRALAATVSAALAMSIVAVPNVSAGTTIYNKTCSVENIFSDFQYFINGNADITQHQVGSVYAGGTAKIGSFGDGAIQDSYVRNLESIISTNFGAYLPDDMKKYKSELLYVGNTQAELEANWAVPSWMYLYDPKYIKPTTDAYVEANAFAGLITQSQSMADAAVSSNVSVNSSSNVVTIDLTTNKSATVKASDIKADTTVMLKGISKAADFGTSQYTISVIGIGSSTFNLNSKNVVYYDTTAGSNVNISDALRAYAIEAGDVQILKKGSMKLIWNMPDATGTITCGALAGHLLAPRAYVDVDSGGAYAGHHEGGIIAASVKATQSQGHFYPYNPLGTSLPNPTVEKPGDIELIKTYTVDGSAVN
ncbi:MAG: choice-of-anchor A family protein, partial [Oscillospiraceae bacterium]|nr:choice-of-anchor A family protein [Oscillospiraceae bacterium]